MGDSSEKLSGACLVPKSRFVGRDKLRIYFFYSEEVPVLTSPSFFFFLVCLFVCFCFVFSTTFPWGSSPLHKPVPKGMVFE